MDGPPDLPFCRRQTGPSPPALQQPRGAELPEIVGGLLRVLDIGVLVGLQHGGDEAFDIGACEASWIERKDRGEGGCGGVYSLTCQR
jgi:hypothetical protein